MNSKKPQLYALTGIRFLAAIYIVLFHYLLAEPLDSLPHILKNFIYNGFSGVSLFFVLSGFILAYNYLDVEKPVFTNPKKFWIARFARIYPLYLVSLIISIPGFINRMIEAGNVLEALPTLVLNPLLLQAWTPWTSCQWNCPGWAVSTEAFCYLLFPIISPHLYKLKKDKLLPLLLVIWLVSLIMPILYLTWFSALQSANLWLHFITYAPVFHLPQFIIGVITGILFLHRVADSNALDYSNSLVFPEKGRKQISSIVFLFLLFLFLFSNINYVLINNGLLAPLFALLIYGLSYEKSRLTFLLSLSWLVFLGEISYAIYLMHLPISSWLVFLGDKFLHQKIGLFNFLILRISILLAISILMLLFIERPARRKILSYFSKSQVFIKS